MKIYLLLSLLLFAIHLSCGDDPFSRPDNVNTRQRRYQTNPNTQQFTPNLPQQDNNNYTSTNRIHIVAAVMSSEVAALEEMRKYKNYGYPANIYQTTKGQYAISIATFSDRQNAEQVRQNEIRKGKIPQSSFIAEMENSSGPRYDATPQPNTPIPETRIPENQPYNDPRTYNLPTDEPPVYQAPRTESYTGDQYHIVLGQASTYTDAVQTANRYIQQGLTVFVYEKTNGYAITFGKIFTGNEAAAWQNQIRQNSNLPNAIVTPRDGNWRNIVYP
ncbi:hypothetical protein JW964_12905 [candidate division KSB1 bacterium]|nr:hypothetical protein [candidate division KSB1 bacterium]